MKELEVVKIKKTNEILFVYNNEEDVINLDSCTEFFDRLQKAECKGYQVFFIER